MRLNRTDRQEQYRCRPVANSSGCRRCQVGEVPPPIDAIRLAHDYHTLQLTSLTCQLYRCGMRGSDPQPQDLVVTLLGTYVRSLTRPVWSGGLVQLLGELGFSTAAARVALARLVTRGLLTRERDGRLVRYRITSRCMALLEEGDARIFALGQRRVTTACWTVLWHSIPDSRKLQRARLAKRLRFLGFGSLQDATWIAPRDREPELIALLDDIGVRNFAGVIVGRSSESLDFAGIASRAWDLRGLNQRYTGFVRTFRRYGADDATHRLRDQQAFKLRTLLVNAFREFPALDPELPDDIVNPPPHRDEAVSLFHRLYKALAVPSQRHFSSVALR